MFSCAHCDRPSAHIGLFLMALMMKACREAFQQFLVYSQSSRIQGHTESFVSKKTNLITMNLIKNKSPFRNQICVMHQRRVVRPNGVGREENHLAVCLLYHTSAW